MSNSFLAPDPSATTVPRRTWLALAVVVLGISMALLDTTIVNVALPTLQQSSAIRADEATLSWVISGYALAFGLVLIPAGRLGDRIGHKWVFIIGMTGFVIASLLCSLAQSSTELVISRVVQGMFGGIFFPPITAIIQLMFPLRMRGRAFAITGAAIGVSTSLGPIAGGLLIQAFGENDGWRTIFLVNLPFGVLAVIAAFILLPAGSAGATAVGVDVVGLALLAGSLVAILVPLIQGQQEGWPLWTALSLIGGIIGLAIFAFWERRVAARGRTPLVPPHLFVRLAFTAGVLLSLVYFAAYTSVFFVISLLWQSGLGHTPLESGLVAVPFAIANVIGAGLSDRLTQRLGRNVLVIGLMLLAVGLASLWLILVTVESVELTNWMLLPSLALAGAGTGLFIAPNLQFIVATVDRSEAGAASGVLGTVQRLGAAAGVAVVGSVLFGTLVFPSDRRPTAADIGNAFGHSSALAIGVSALLAAIAFALVFVLPKKVSEGTRVAPQRAE
ncbi:MAG TPA: MFS transporter [Pseudolysinimonas sp.]|nr:MFS transporter [Pseudolysinimonas sp.]